MKVVHCKKEPYDVYIGRPSIFGNPYVIGQDGSRARVIELYEVYIRGMIYFKPEIINEIRALKGKTLGCWCSPQACHGDVLIKLVEEYT